MLKLTGGEHKGRPLKWLDSTRIRPTPARVREALCNIFKSEIADSHWWDLCCGSGSVGLEMLSRDAAQVHFVDHNRQSLNYLRQNLRQFELKDRARITTSGLRPFLKRQKQIDAHFIYCDPPYDDHPLYLEVLQRLKTLPWQPPAGAPDKLTLILETRHRKLPWYEQPEWLDGWDVRDTRRYGDIQLNILERQA